MHASSAQLQFLEQKKNPTVAVLLSFIISGAGQLYNGEIGKGIGMIVGYILCVAASSLVLPLFILIALWIWGMIDANTRAKAMNEALRVHLEQEEASKQMAAAEQERLNATTVTTQEFVTQVEKFFKLFQSGILSAAEFESKKQELITLLTAKQLREAPEDFLTAMIPLLQRQALSEPEIARIKAAVL